MSQILVELKNIEKDFSGVKALRGVSFSMGAEVRALVGENGAGKSTLMKILSGVYPHGQFQGEIWIRGVVQKFSSPEVASKAGVAIIHQELSFFHSLTVAENIFVGHYPMGTIPGLVDWQTLFQEARAVLDRLGLSDIDPRMLMSELSVGNQQLVEIAKVARKNADLIVFDEPTSALSPGEIERLFLVIADLRKQGKGIIYISHKLEEVYALADSITVLRDGASVTTQMAKDFPREKLIQEMVGRELSQLYPTRKGKPQSQWALELKGLHLQHRHRKLGLCEVGPFDLSVRKGEILGLAGLLGSGRTEIFEALVGSQHWEVTQREYPQAINYKIGKSPRQSLALGLVMLHEDRRRSGNLMRRPILENASVSYLAMRAMPSLLGKLKELIRVQEGLSRFRTKYSTLDQEIQTLSGGNQQKVLFERALETGPRILLLDEPTRGVDVGARHEIYEILLELADHGMAIVMASSDLGEILGLSNRVAVFSRGQLKGILGGESEESRAQLTQEKIMTLATQA